MSKRKQRSTIASIRFLSSKTFWLPFLLCLTVAGVFFAWELGLMIPLFPTLPRPPATTADWAFGILLTVLLSLNTGLLRWRSRYGSCPAGTKRASGIAGALGFVTLLCPVCIALPLSVVGLSISLVFLTPFVPLLRLLAVILLVAATFMLWPRD